MKPRRENLEVFNLSFLDIISSGFAAVVLLVLLSKPLTDTVTSDAGSAEQLLKQVVSTRGSIAKSAREIKQRQDRLAGLKQIAALMKSSAVAMKQQLGNKTRALEKLNGDLKGLSLVQTSMQRASIRPASSLKRDAEVGGIPVDSDYVIFIVDTSGSMLSIWNRVSREMLNVLKIHPHVKGFQIMNDNGIHLISSYAGRWISDTPQRRVGVMKLFRLWRSASNSSPVEGLEVALKRYAKPGVSLSIYVFGDDYTGSSYDPVIQSIVDMNTDKITGKRLAKIHAVGFLDRYATNRFSILMREVTKRNGGTFIGLP